MSTEVVVGLFTLGGTLGGIALGFGGQWFLEQRRESRSFRAAIGALFYEMLLLAASLESVVKDRQRTRKEIRAPMWNRYGPELINALPTPFLTVLQLHYDLLDPIAHHYSKVVDEEISDERTWLKLSATMLGWAYRADRLLDLQNERARRHRPPWRRGILEKSASASRVWDEVQSTSDLKSKIEVIQHDVEQHALQRLRGEGYDVDDEGKLVRAGSCVIDEVK